MRLGSALITPVWDPNKDAIKHSQIAWKWKSVTKPSLLACNMSKSMRKPEACKGLSVQKSLLETL